MAQTHEFEVVIIGAGPAGLCAGMYAGRGMLKTVVLERGAPGGELLNTELIEDYPGFESILGYELAQKFADHATKFGADIRTGVVVSSIKKRDDGLFETTTESGDTYLSPTVIVTAGGTPIKLGIPGELEYAGKGVSYCAVCDGAFFRGHTIAVVGGGDAAVEEADYLTRYADRVYLIHRREELRASKIIQERAFENPKIQMIWNTVVERAVGDDDGLLHHLELRDVNTGERRELPGHRHVRLHRVQTEHRGDRRPCGPRRHGVSDHRLEHADFHAGPVRGRRRAGAGDTPGDDRGRGCHDGRHRCREVPEGARRRRKTGGGGVSRGGA